MLTLAVDTTADFGSIALADEAEIREEVLLHAPQGFSQVLFGHIRALLDRQNVPLRTIELFAAASGPGSFTGVRVGLSAIKGLAEVLAKKVVAVSNLEALSRLGGGDLRATIIDARRGEVYAALFDRLGQPVIDPRVISFPKFLASLPAVEIEWIATDFSPFRATLAGTRFEGQHVVTAPRALAAGIARIAVERARAGRAQNPAAIEANYVRRSDAEIFWKDDGGRPSVIEQKRGPG
jgi:tRNA threonylcarbamoyladenosine biosynthesis protein TsaB